MENSPPSSPTPSRLLIFWKIFQLLYYSNPLLPTRLLIFEKFPTPSPPAPPAIPIAPRLLTYVGKFPFDKFVQRQSAGNTKNLAIGTFLEVLKKERVFWNFKNSKKIFMENYTFFLNDARMQFRIFDFNKIRFKEKCFLGLFSETVGNLPRKDL